MIVDTVDPHDSDWVSQCCVGSVLLHVRFITIIESLVEEATESWGDHLEKFKIFYCKN